MTENAMESREAADSAPTWVSKASLPSFSPFPGVAMQSIIGQALMANWVTFSPNQVVPHHHHPHEQLGIVLEGNFEITIAGETRQLGPGDAYTIPSNVPHSARTFDGECVLLDIFTPIREDYVQP